MAIRERNRMKKAAIFIMFFWVGKISQNFCWFFPLQSCTSHLRDMNGYSCQNANSSNLYSIQTCFLGNPVMLSSLVSFLDLSCDVPSEKEKKSNHKTMTNLDWQSSTSRKKQRSAYCAPWIFNPFVSTTGWIKKMIHW